MGTPDLHSHMWFFPNLWLQLETFLWNAVEYFTLFYLYLEPRGPNLFKPDNAATHKVIALRRCVEWKSLSTPAPNPDLKPTFGMNWNAECMTVFFFTQHQCLTSVTIAYVGVNGQVSPNVWLYIVILVPLNLSFSLSLSFSVCVLNKQHDAWRSIKDLSKQVDYKVMEQPDTHSEAWWG